MKGCNYATQPVQIQSSTRQSSTAYGIPQRCHRGLILVLFTTLCIVIHQHCFDTSVLCQPNNRVFVMHNRIVPVTHLSTVGSSYDSSSQIHHTISFIFTSCSTYHPISPLSSSVTLRHGVICR